MNRARAIVLVAGAVAVPRAVRAQAAQLKIATVPVENGAQAYFAQDLGFFTKAGLEVDLQPISNGGAIAAAVASGDTDIGFATVIPLAVAHSKGLPLVFVAAGYRSNDRRPTSCMVVPENSPIRKAADLDGKIVATNGLATINEYAPRAWVDANGGDATTLKFTEMPFSAMPGALAAGRIDAAFIAEPYATAAKQDARVLFYLTAVCKDGEMLGGWFSTRSWARAHADLVRRFDAAMRESAVWANANPGPSAEILVKYLKIDPKLAAAMNRSTFAEQLDPAKMQQSIEIAAKYAKFAPFPARELVFIPG
jgi:NitT/TauT family transport system substrate-binding protein